MRKAAVEAVVEEVLRAKLGDKRRESRLLKVMERFAAKPGEPVTKAMVTPAEAQAAYQLLNSSDFTGHDIFKAHAERTLQRCQDFGVPLFIHDTTDISFSGERRKGVGPLNDGGQGFRSHVCIAATLDRVPLGTVAYEHIVRDGAKRPASKERGKRSDRESLRWHRIVEESAKIAEGICSPIHLMDSEADDYELFALLLRLGQRFVVRAAQNRRIAGGIRLRDALEASEYRFERTVNLSRRTGESRSRSNRNQPREARSARLVVSTTRVSLLRPDNCPEDLPEQLGLNVVLVREQGTSEDSQPVEWVLLTTEPVDNEEAAALVVDAYRTRWVIEEFFKVVKSGCGFEKSQLESFRALEKLFAMLLPIAWQLLLLRSAADENPDAPATSFLSPLQLEVLGTIEGANLPPSPTVADAVAALARLGGHIRPRERAGWKVISKGLYEVNVVARFLSLMKRDQV